MADDRAHPGDPQHWPAWATEPVVLAPPDPAWQLQAEREGLRLEKLLGVLLMGRVEHVGSTAVAGLPAKPVLDLQAEVDDLEVAERVGALLEDEGWHLVAPELDPWRRLLVKVVDGRRFAHLHLVAPGTAHARERLHFRDALRADPALAASYATLKHQLADRHTHDREAYTAAKGAFVQHVLQRHRRQQREREQLVRAGWDRVADRYAERFFHELSRKPLDRALLERFVADAARAAAPGRNVVDLGCGPGHVAAYVAQRGAAVVGIDLSPAMVQRARTLSPGVTFRVGSLLDLDPQPGSWAGALLLYSLINLRREDVPEVLRRVCAGLAAGAPVLIAVHVGEGEVRVDELLGEAVPMVGIFFTPAEMTAFVRDAGLVIDEVVTRPPYDGEHPTQRLYVLAHANRRG